MRLEMDDFATYILNEKDYIQKMMITYYLSKKTGIFFDKSIVLKTEITKLFMDYDSINVDKDMVLTAMLLANCKRVDSAQKMGQLETYAKDGAAYLSELGFNKRFCKICEEINRYSGNENREIESDILEIVDQFTGLILNRVERPAFTPEEALIILKDRNFRDVNNRFLDDFCLFIQNMEKIVIKKSIGVSVIKKLVSLHNNEPNVKTFISKIGNEYDEQISTAIKRAIKNQEIGQTTEIEYKKVNSKNRPLFSKEIAEKVLNHESKYKMEEKKAE